MADELVGSDACSQRGCSSMRAVPCAYTDRRGHRCGTSWCVEHQVVVDGKPYCRRHAGIVRALAQLSSESKEQGPDLDNRAPSLCEWIANDIDGEVQTMLTSARGANEDWKIAADPLTLILAGTPRRRTWERNWKLADHTGTKLKSAISVDEENDAEVQVRVDAVIVDRVVPPWIAARREGGSLAEEGETRRRFRERILRAMSEAVSKHQF